ncbi:MAG TPA: ATP-dependent DNA helicase RecG [Candidatus Polarisedimenticolia bacterium]|nr:ATP-dependent DNA helicase RecG [Candidatus Polarisedimenticolia bacterium]
MPPLTLDTPLQYVKGVGPRKAEGLAERGYRHVEDLLFHLPFRYEDRSRFVPIDALRPGVRATISGRILSATLKRTRRRGLTLFEAVVDDGSAGLGLVWFNQPYLRDILKAGREVILYGEAALSRYRGRVLQMENPQYEIVSRDGTEAIHTGRVVPIYQRLGDLSPRMLRAILHAICGGLPDTVPDPVPPALLSGGGMMARAEALRRVHFPPDGADLSEYQSRTSPAHRRLIFEEFFLLQIALGLRRRGLESERRPPYTTDERMREKLLAILPFHLTGAQRRAFREIVGDLTSPRPMNRLLQGDVGSGKTIVALLTMLLAVENGYQAALMAPTEILAEQHHRGIEALAAPGRYRIQLLTGARTAAERRPVLRGVEDGYVQLLIGTHALIQESVVFHRLGLVVIDEQHRFGVVQRAALRGKGAAAVSPDVLVMTATPIPRSLALTLYGDLDLSVIDELPPGRHPTRTHLRPESARARIYDFIRQEVAAGRQAYIVLPLVEESEKSDLRAAVDLASQLGRREFRDLTVGLVHGRMKPAERDDAMRRFAAGDIDVLVGTTVIEVGIDVRNASVMVVEHAERFGLSQLHQLRGRVGRGPHASHCILVHGEELSEEAARRLGVLAESSDGFHIAEKDLEFRGPGEFLGTRQSGLPEIRIGNIIRDFVLLEEARRAAGAILEEIRSEPVAGPSRHRTLLDHMKRSWGDRIGLMDIG